MFKTHQFHAIFRDLGIVLFYFDSHFFLWQVSCSSVLFLLCLNLLWARRKRNIRIQVSSSSKNYSLWPAGGADAITTPLKQMLCDGLLNFMNRHLDLLLCRATLPPLACLKESAQQVNLGLKTPLHCRMSLLTISCSNDYSLILHFPKLIEQSCWWETSHYFSCSSTWRQEMLWMEQIRHPALQHQNIVRIVLQSLISLLEQ